MCFRIESCTRSEKSVVTYGLSSVVIHVLTLVQSCILTPVLLSTLQFVPTCVLTYVICSNIVLMCVLACVPSPFLTGIMSDMCFDICSNMCPGMYPNISCFLAYVAVFAKTPARTTLQPKSSAHYSAVRTVQCPAEGGNEGGNAVGRTDITSRDPHLTGGEPYSRVFKGVNLGGWNNDIGMVSSYHQHHHEGAILLSATITGYTSW